ncbi:hypothetical protein [Prevotella melaninogenica]|jgi:hypothetical protein|uniref:Uncharacterized protein n=1 Tax=Prevotella melaninogenica DNF00666 TaxID=1401073 RepID=A0A096AVJ1_9BACT|nr:hypothetical protein [Prevotella melaninogenica]KGF51108.1 hypothetical protein HMPREF0661_03875 [Prevotella melaninogenica DNF00666]
MKKEFEIQEFVDKLEMTVLTEENSILLDGMVGTSGSNTVFCNTDSSCNEGNNCHGGNCIAGCGGK